MKRGQTVASTAVFPDGDGVSFRFDEVPPGTRALYASWQGARRKYRMRGIGGIV